MNLLDVRLEFKKRGHAGVHLYCLNLRLPGFLGQRARGLTESPA